LHSVTRSPFFSHSSFMITSPLAPLAIVLALICRYPFPVAFPQFAVSLLC
jgi:hypothetical protein